MGCLVGVSLVLVFAYEVFEITTDNHVLGRLKMMGHTLYLEVSQQQHRAGGSLWSHESGC
jgi:hypothetical protein